MAEPSSVPGLDPMRARLLLGALAIVACGLLAIVPVAGLDPVTGARRQGSAAQRNGQRAIEALEQIVAAQPLLRRDADGDGLVEFGTLADLHAAGLLDAGLAGGRAHGYVFDVRPSTTRPAYRWLAIATPETPGETGDRTYVVNQEGLVHALGGPTAWNDGCALPTSATRVGR